MPLKFRKHLSSLLKACAFNIDPQGRRNGFDYLTGLPTTLRFIPELEKHLSRQSVGLFYIDIKRFKSVEAIYGRDVCNRILKTIASTLLEAEVEFYGRRDKLGVCSLVGDDFLLFVDHPGDYDLNSFRQEYQSLRDILENRINQAIGGYEVEPPLSLHIGYYKMDHGSHQQVDTILYQAIKEASLAAKRYSSPGQHADWQLMHQIIQNQNVRTLYQPIVSLQDGSIIGREALTRGPSGSHFESPLNLFAAARDYGCLHELESLCTDMAIASSSPGLGSQCLLFLNINPVSLNLVNHRNEVLQKALSGAGIAFSQVVLELTERTAIADYRSLRQTLAQYRQQGFRIAVDDAGAGYSSLQAIAELNPDFVKIDMSLIRGIDRNTTKRVLVETLINFSFRINARIICEGIETREEMKTLCDLGCDYGQGFFIAPPGILQQQIRAEARDCIKRFSRLNRVSIQSLPGRIGDIAVFEPCLKPEITVSEAIDLFKADMALNGLAVCRDDIPAGILMRDRLNAMLSSRFGYDLFHKKPVTEVMDPDPLIIPWHAAIEDAARQLAPRLNNGFAESIIVTREDRYLGLVTTSKMVETMARLQLEQARDSNPLTGLPGNQCITRRLLADLGETSGNMAVMYLDLDNFKAFNDYYGFERGDCAILMTAEIIVESVRDAGNPGDLPAHLGGDDFVVITTEAMASLIAVRIIERFDDRVKSLYDEEDLGKGYITTEDRVGRICRFPIMSISIAGVETRDQSFANHLQISEVAAEVKRFAKSVPGSNYQSNRRRSPRAEPPHRKMAASSTGV